MKIIIAMVAAASLSLSLSACSGGSGNGDSSGVETSKTLDTLSGDEVVDLCDYGARVVERSQVYDFVCYRRGVEESLQEGDCERIYSECIATISPFECLGENRPACASEITVGEIEQCLRAQERDYDFSGISCLSTIEEIEERSNQAEPPECAAIDQQCPGL